MKAWSAACLVVLLFSFLATWGLRHYALSAKLIDVPNARSSHSQPTPRGGGVAIVLAFLGALGWMLLSETITLSWGLALLGAGAGVALLGFLDDHGHIAARWRLLGHFSAAIWLLLWVGGAPTVDFSGRAINLGWLGHILAALYLVWMLNLYNFMDGIDGIASVEAISVCLGGGGLFSLRPPSPPKHHKNLPSSKSLPQAAG